MAELQTALEGAAAAMQQREAAIHAAYRHDLVPFREVQQTSAPVVRRPGKPVQGVSDADGTLHDRQEAEPGLVLASAESGEPSDEGLVTLLRETALGLGGPPPRDEMEADRRELRAWMQGAEADSPTPSSAEPQGEDAATPRRWEGTYELTDGAAVYVISVAAQLSGLHPQTLRQYDRLGLVSPDRTGGRGRRYSARDIELLRQVQALSQDEGINLAGIKRIVDLENQVAALQSRVAELEAAIEQAAAAMGQREAAVRAAYRRDLVPYAEAEPTNALVGWRPRRPGKPPGA